MFLRPRCRRLAMPRHPRKKLRRGRSATCSSTTRGCTSGSSAEGRSATCSCASGSSTAGSCATCSSAEGGGATRCSAKGGSACSRSAQHWHSSCDHPQRPNQPGRQQSADKPERHPQHDPNRNIQHEAELDRQSQHRARNVELPLGRWCIAQSDRITQSEYPRPHYRECGNSGMA